MTDPQLPPPPGAVTTGAPAPGYQAPPPGAYAVPVGGYSAPAGSYMVPDAPTTPSGFLGMLALSLSLVAAVLTPIIAGINTFEIGRLVPRGITSSARDLSVLSPVRDQVLWAELSFWTGTILGIAAIVIGIVAIRTKSGRGAGIAAIVVAVIAAAIFFAVAIIAFATGSAAGFATITA